MIIFLMIVAGLLLVAMVGEENEKHKISLTCAFITVIVAMTTLYMLSLN